MLLAGVDKAGAAALLAQSGGFVRGAIDDRRPPANELCRSF
jgi:hypothetical protein